MTAFHTSPGSSPFYPGRAGYFSRFCVGASRLIRALISKEGSTDLTLWKFLRALLIPGLAVEVFTNRLAGLIAASLYAVAFFAWIFFLGETISNLAFAAMIGLHLYSITLLFRNSWPSLGIPVRALIAALLLLCPYLFLQGYVQRMVQTLYVNGKLIRVNLQFPAAEVRPGHTMLFSSRQTGSAAIDRVLAPSQFGKVLAQSGDQIEFFPGSYKVNDMTYPAEASMPSEGGFVVPSGHWFVWPTLVGRDNALAQNAAFIVKLGTVAFEQYQGTGFHFWFWKAAQ